MRDVIKPRRFDPLDMQTATLADFTSTLRETSAAGMNIRDIIIYGLEAINKFNGYQMTSDDKDYLAMLNYSTPPADQSRRARNRWLAGVVTEYNYWHTSLPPMPILCKQCRSTGYLDRYVPAKKCHICNGTGHIIEND